MLYVARNLTAIFSKVKKNCKDSKNYLKVTFELFASKWRLAAPNQDFNGGGTLMTRNGGKYFCLSREVMTSCKIAAGGKMGIIQPWQRWI